MVSTTTAYRQCDPSTALLTSSLSTEEQLGLSTRMIDDFLWQNMLYFLTENINLVSGMITDLFIDKFKFKGVNVKSKVPQLTVSFIKSLKLFFRS